MSTLKEVLMHSDRRERVVLAAVLLGLFTAVLGTHASRAGASGRPSTWSAHAEASGLRASVVKPAALPTADELAGLSIPYARTETDSSPSGRAVASWLWPGEGVADAKSLVAIGLDASAAQSEVDARKKRHPGTDGCAPERKLVVPEVPNPNGGPPLVPAHPLTSPVTGTPLYDPLDDPCGEVAARTVLQTLVHERVPDYPFWSHALWPPNRAEDVSDQHTACDTTNAFPRSWELPQQSCPAATGAERAGSTQARSTEKGDWGTSRWTDLAMPGVFAVSSLTALARSEWLGDAMVSSASVTLEDLDVASLVHIDSLVSTATSFSDGQRSRTALVATGVTVTLGGHGYKARLERGRIVVADQAFPAEVQQQITAALDAAMVKRGVSVAFGGVDPSADAAAGGARTEGARVAAVTISLTAADALNGASTVRLSLGVAETDSSAQASGVFVPPLLPRSHPPFIAPEPPAGNVPGRPSITTAPTTDPHLFRAPNEVSIAFPVSRPIPVGVTALAIVLAAVLAAVLVASGIWETLW